MRKRISQFQCRVQQLLDAVCATVAFTLAIGLRRSLHDLYPQIFPMFDALWSNAWLYILLVPLWVFLFDVLGLYQRREIQSPLVALSAVIRANLVGVVAVFFLLYLLKIKNIPRALILLYAMWDVVLMMIKETLVEKFSPFWIPTVNVLLAGGPAGIQPIHTRLKKLASRGIRTIGWLRDAACASIAEPGLPELPELGRMEDFERILHQYSVDVVVLCPAREPFAGAQKVIELCETEGVEVWLAADFFRTRIARPEIDEFQDIPVLVFSTTPPLSWPLLTKRIIDIAGSLILIVLTAPLMLVIALLIKLTSPGPVLFKQKRCTLHGRVFNMLKFRTMIMEAEALKRDLMEQNEMQGPVFKIRNDPRVTPIGRFLRKHSLDELPQLFNVLLGEMSLVGPRPPVPEEVAQYENWQRRRLSMRAGMTCLWQISGRNELSFDDWMKLDLEYIDNWSLTLDFAILLKTPMAIIHGTGY